jgi:ketosteroid isomerase-like protein
MDRERTLPMKTLTVNAAVLLTLASVTTILAQARPNFSGVWKLDPRRSELIGAAARDSGAPPAENWSWTWRIDHREPTISVAVNITNPRGTRDFSFTCTTDGTECVNELPSLNEVRRSTASWNGNVLVMKTKAETHHGAFEAEDRISTSDNGRTLRFERVVTDTRGQRTSTQVFRKVESAAATDSQLPSVDLPVALDRVLRDYESAYRRGGSAVAELFTEDGFVLAGGRPPIRGRVAIAEYYGAGRGPLSLRAIAFAAEGSAGWIIGGYSTARDAPDAGKFTLTLRKRPDGRWLIVSDMDNSNRPPLRR